MKQITVIDDEKSHLTIIPLILKNHKVTTIQPSPSESVEDFFQKNLLIFQKTEIFIIDNKMFKFTGIELMKKIKNTNSLKNIPILCNSSLDKIPELQTLQIPLIKYKSDMVGLQNWVSQYDN